MKRALAAFLVTMTFGSPVCGTEVHGQTDVFSSPAAALAWAILRGPDEARTFVVVRVTVDTAIDAVVVTGRDPFTQEEKHLAREAPRQGRVEVRIPRAGFADFPRTDWHFFAKGEKLRLHVFYLGVPDTTPEFADEARLDAYLDGRIARLK